MHEIPNYEKLYHIMTDAAGRASELLIDTFFKCSYRLPENNYRKKYHLMVNKVEDAIKILIAAQRKCEEIYLDSTEPRR